MSICWVSSAYYPANLAFKTAVRISSVSSSAAAEKEGEVEQRTSFIQAIV